MARTTGSAGPRTEAAIRAAAVRLIAAHGYEGVSMRQLAEAVGVQAGAIYRYFPTKQDLLASMMRAHLRHLLARWRAVKPEGADAVRLLVAFARFHIRYHISRRDEVFINYMELRSLAPEHRDAVLALRSEYEDELRAILARGIETGAFRVRDIPVTAMALIAMLTGVTTWWQPGGRLSSRDLEAVYADLALGAVGAAPAGTWPGPGRAGAEAQAEKSSRAFPV